MTPVLWYPLNIAQDSSNQLKSIGTDDSSLYSVLTTLNTNGDGKIAPYSTGYNSSSASQTNAKLYINDEDGVKYKQYLKNRNFSFGFWFIDRGTSRAGSKKYILSIYDNIIIYLTYNTTTSKYGIICTIQSHLDTNKITLIATYEYSKWTHIFLTRNLQTNTFNLYINGELAASQAVNYDMSLFDIQTSNFLTLLNASSDTSAAALVYIQDFRFYDSCLTEKEIYNIYLGLIVHYPLNDTACANPNLLKAPDPRPNTLMNKSYINTSLNYDIAGHSISVIKATIIHYYTYVKGWSQGFDKNTSIYNNSYLPHWVSLNNKLTMKFQMENGGNTSVGGVDKLYIESSEIEDLSIKTRVANSSLTLSFDACATNYLKTSIMHFVLVPTGGKYYSLSYTVNVEGTKWKTYKEHISPNIEIGNNYNLFIKEYVDDASNTVYMQNVKLTADNLPYLNVGTCEQFVNLVEDKSGYSNNASVNTVSSVSNLFGTVRNIYNDTAPFYDHSIKLLNPCTISLNQTNVIPQYINAMTINMWVKLNELPLIAVTILNLNNIILQIVPEPRDGTNYVKYRYNCNINDENMIILTGDYTFSTDWHMITLTYDIDEQLAKLYIDAIVVTTVDLTATSASYSTSHNVSIGNSATSTRMVASNISMSDFRFYVNALSNNDILELYTHNGVYYSSENKHLYVNTIKENN